MSLDPICFLGNKPCILWFVRSRWSKALSCHNIACRMQPHTQWWNVSSFRSNIIFALSGVSWDILNANVSGRLETNIMCKSSIFSLNYIIYYWIRSKMYLDWFLPSFYLWRSQPWHIWPAAYHIRPKENKIKNNNNTFLPELVVQINDLIPNIDEERCTVQYIE